MAVKAMEQIEIENEKLLQQKKEIDKLLKKNAETKRDITHKEETSVGMSFWRYFAKTWPDEYEKVIKSKGFDEYVTTDYLRRLFGLSPLQKDRSNEMTGRVYLNVPYNEREEAKKLGARWDANAKRWYIPEEIPVEPLSKWLDVSEAPKEESVPEPTSSSSTHNPVQPSNFGANDGDYQQQQF